MHVKPAPGCAKAQPLPPTLPQPQPIGCCKHVSCVSHLTHQQLQLVSAELDQLRRSGMGARVLAGHTLDEEEGCVVGNQLLNINIRRNSSCS